MESPPATQLLSMNHSPVRVTSAASWDDTSIPPPSRASRVVNGNMEDPGRQTWLNARWPTPKEATDDARQLSNAQGRAAVLVDGKGGSKYKLMACETATVSNVVPSNTGQDKQRICLVRHTSRVIIL